MEVGSATVGWGMRVHDTLRAMSRKTDAVVKQLRAWGLAHFPGAHLKSPWPGHKDLAVNDKTFAYLSVEGEPFGVSCKLPQTSHMALMLPFCTPTPYGLGKSGWVSASCDDSNLPPLEMLQAWIDESYRAQAPKKLLKQMGQGKTPPPKKPAPKKPAAKSNKR
jgi:predicted DNA-binding protein (MmcQ/YjbR family)